MIYASKRILIFGGAGSLGRTLVSRFTKQNAHVHVFSRDEAKHHYLKQDFPKVNTIIGDIRNYDSIVSAVQSVCPTLIVNCAALKQVPTCEYHPYEAVLTNTIGAHNLVRVVEAFCRNIRVLSISTDKACKPVNSYGMTKALQERIHLNGRNSIFNCVRYGNVLESTGSVVPVFKKMISENKHLTVTHRDMTRFFLSLNQAVDLIMVALKERTGGKIFIPKVPAARVWDLAELMTPSCSGLPPVITKIRPGEKLDEILISEEELPRTEDRGGVYVIHDIKSDKEFHHLGKEYSSADHLMDKQELKNFLKEYGVI